MVTTRPMQRPMNMMNMPRMPQGVASFNLASHANMAGGMHPGGIPMQRGPGITRTHASLGVLVRLRKELSLVKDIPVLTAIDQYNSWFTFSEYEEPIHHLFVSVRAGPFMPESYQQEGQSQLCKSKATIRIASTVKAIVDERIGNGEVSNKQGDFLQILISANTLSDNEKLSFRDEWAQLWRTGERCDARLAVRCGCDAAECGVELEKSPTPDEAERRGSAVATGERELEEEGDGSTADGTGEAVRPHSR
ncbi:hypothetical protein Syun_025672 [Stephania yunnanensis]|uniref:Small ribosomal subunit protein mS29 n=1 Tax=Stephania yunnanensis TaxID=152371 RepID=A0AAP0EXG2_9MAGN